MGTRTDRLRRALIGGAVGLVTFVLVDRAAMAVLVEDGEFGGKRLAPYDVPVFQSSMAAAVERLRGDVGDELLAFDAVLGWEPRPGARSGEISYDRFGARDLFPAATRAASGQASELARSAAPKPGARRILAFGCSFTHGTEVANEDAWLAELARQRPDLDVFNFGVPAYGLYQALLRIERRAATLEPDEIWLGLMPSAAQRPSTHFRPLLRPWTAVPWLKPRVELGSDGALMRLPNPVDSREAALAVFERPGAFDGLLAGRDPWYDAIRPAFQGGALQHLFSGRLFWTWRTFGAGSRMRGLDGRGDSLVPLHSAIAREARRAAEATGATLRYLILPGPLDLPPPHGDGGVITVALLDQLTAEGIATLDVTPAVLSVDAGERWASGGHYSVAANRSVGAWLASRIE